MAAVVLLLYKMAETRLIQHVCRLSLYLHCVLPELRIPWCLNQPPFHLQLIRQWHLLDLQVLFVPIPYWFWKYIKLTLNKQVL